MFSLFKRIICQDQSDARTRQIRYERRFHDAMREQHILDWQIRSGTRTYLSVKDMLKGGQN